MKRIVAALATIVTAFGFYFYVDYQAQKSPVKYKVPWTTSSESFKIEDKEIKLFVEFCLAEDVYYEVIIQKFKNLETEKEYYITPIYSRQIKKDSLIGYSTSYREGNFYCGVEETEKEIPNSIPPGNYRMDFLAIIRARNGKPIKQEYRTVEFNLYD